MVTKEQVEAFLEELHTKIFGILFSDDRDKNSKKLQELEIVTSYRKVVVENLRAEDYVKGPVVDELNRLGEMWVLGKDVKGREIYIKVMSDDEKIIIRAVCDRFKNCSSRGISNICHEEPAWKKYHATHSRIPFSEAFTLKAL